MIKNIAAAAALALTTGLLTCAPAQAAQNSFPLPPFGYAVYSSAPGPLLWHAPLAQPAHHPLFHPAYVAYGLR